MDLSLGNDDLVLLLGAFGDYFVVLGAVWRRGFLGIKHMYEDKMACDVFGDKLIKKLLKSILSKLLSTNMCKASLTFLSNNPKEYSIPNISMSIYLSNQRF